MKIARLERLRQLQREYHQSHQWRLTNGGLYIPHSYAERKPDSLSYWDDVGFILNGRRIIVWWQHPRHVYAEEIQEKAWHEAAITSSSNWFAGDSTKNYKRLGRSRKKIISYTMREQTPEMRQ